MIYFINGKRDDIAYNDFKKGDPAEIFWKYVMNSVGVIENPYLNQSKYTVGQNSSDFDIMNLYGWNLNIM